MTYLKLWVWMCDVKVNGKGVLFQNVVCEMGGACGAYEGGERGIQGSGGET